MFCKLQQWLHEVFVDTLDKIRLPAENRESKGR